MKGHIRQRDKRSWRLKFDAGPDPATGKRKIQYHTFRGTAAFRYATIKFPNTLPIVFTDRGGVLSMPTIRTRNAIDSNTIRALAAAVKEVS